MNTTVQTFGIGRDFGMRPKIQPVRFAAFYGFLVICLPLLLILGGIMACNLYLIGTGVGLRALRILVFEFMNHRTR